MKITKKSVEIILLFTYIFFAHSIFAMERGPEAVVDISTMREILERELRPVEKQLIAANAPKLLELIPTMDEDALRPLYTVVTTQIPEIKSSPEAFVKTIIDALPPKIAETVGVISVAPERGESIIITNWDKQFQDAFGKEYQAGLFTAGGDWKKFGEPNDSAGLAKSLLSFIESLPAGDAKTMLQRAKLLKESIDHAGTTRYRYFRGPNMLTPADYARVISAWTKKFNTIIQTTTTWDSLQDLLGMVTGIMRDTRLSKTIRDNIYDTAMTKAVELLNKTRKTRAHVGSVAETEKTAAYAYEERVLQNFIILAQHNPEKYADVQIWAQNYLNTLTADDDLRSIDDLIGLAHEMKIFTNQSAFTGETYQKLKEKRKEFDEFRNDVKEMTDSSEEHKKLLKEAESIRAQSEQVAIKWLLELCDRSDIKSFIKTSDEDYKREITAPDGTKINVYQELNTFSDYLGSVDVVEAIPELIREELESRINKLLTDISEADRIEKAKFFAASDTLITDLERAKKLEDFTSKKATLLEQIGRGEILARSQDSSLDESIRKEIEQGLNVLKSWLLSIEYAELISTDSASYDHVPDVLAKTLQTITQEYLAYQDIRYDLIKPKSFDERRTCMLEQISVLESLLGQLELIKIGTYTLSNISNMLERILNGDMVLRIPSKSEQKQITALTKTGCVVDGVITHKGLRLRELARAQERLNIRIKDLRELGEKYKTTLDVRDLKKVFRGRENKFYEREQLELMIPEDQLFAMQQAYSHAMNSDLPDALNWKVTYTPEQNLTQLARWLYDHNHDIVKLFEISPVISDPIEELESSLEDPAKLLRALGFSEADINNTPKSALSLANILVARLEKITKKSERMQAAESLARQLANPSKKLALLRRLLLVQEYKKKLKETTDPTLETHELIKDIDDVLTNMNEPDQFFRITLELRRRADAKAIDVESLQICDIMAGNFGTSITTSSDQLRSSVTMNIKQTMNFWLSDTWDATKWSLYTWAYARVKQFNIGIATAGWWLKATAPIAGIILSKLSSKITTVGIGAAATAVAGPVGALAVSMVGSTIEKLVPIDTLLSWAGFAGGTALVYGAGDILTPDIEKIRQLNAKLKEAGIAEIPEDIIKTPQATALDWLKRNFFETQGKKLTALAEAPKTYLSSQLNELKKAEQKFYTILGLTGTPNNSEIKLAYIIKLAELQAIPNAKNLTALHDAQRELLRVQQYVAKAAHDYAQTLQSITVAVLAATPGSLSMTRFRASLQKFWDWLTSKEKSKPLISPEEATDVVHENLEYLRQLKAMNDFARTQNIHLSVDFPDIMERASSNMITYTLSLMFDSLNKLVDEYNQENVGLLPSEPVLPPVE